MAGLTNLLSVLLFVAIKDIYGNQYENNRPLYLQELRNEDMSPVYQLLRQQRNQDRKLVMVDPYEKMLAEKELNQVINNPYTKTPYQNEKVPRHFDHDIITTRREENEANAEPDVFEWNPSVARTKIEMSQPFDDLPTFELTLPDNVSPFTRSDEQSLNKEIENAVDDLKQRLQLLASSPSLRKQADDKTITLDPKFTNSIIDSLIFYAKKQLYSALKVWAENKISENDQLPPPKIED